MTPKKTPEELVKDMERISQGFDKALAKLTPEQREKLLKEIMEGDEED